LKHWKETENVNYDRRPVKPDHPILQQMDNLLQQLVRDETSVTDHDIEYVESLSEVLMVWAGAHMDAEVEMEEVPRTWATYVSQAAEDATKRRN
jgi:hypothetical protein